MSSNFVFLAMFFHVCWVVLLYVALTVLRAPTAWGIDTKSGVIGRYSAYEPKVSANLSNQFEWPLLFYACCILILNMGVTDSYQNILVGVFIFGRVIHSFVHIFTNNIRLRGAVFTVNFLAAFLMWVRLAFIFP